MMTRLASNTFAAVAVAASVALLGACGDDDNDDGAATTTDAPTITIETFQFTPNPATAAGTITVTNADNTTHTFTSGTPDEVDGAFRLELAGPDATDSVDIEPGTYQFFCEIHTSMTGEVTVT